MLLCLAVPASAVPLTGRVTAPGARPGPPHPVERHVEICGPTQPDESLVVGPDDGLANALVVIEGATVDGTAAADQARARLELSGCAFRPHLQVLRAGQVLEVRNADPLAQVIEAFGEGDALAFRLELQLQGQVIPHKIRHPGIYRLASGSGSGWMSGYLAVVAEPFAAVTGPDGSFRIDGLAPGRYQARVWHERLGEKLVPVVVDESGGRLELALGTSR